MSVPPPGATFTERSERYFERELRGPRQVRVRDVLYRLPERRSTLNQVVAAEVRVIEHVEQLSDTFQSCLTGQRDLLGQAQVQFIERIALETVARNDREVSRDPRAPDVAIRVAGVRDLK